MYGAGFHYGESIVNKAIPDKMIEKVTQVGFHFQGLADINTFQRKRTLPRRPYLRTRNMSLN